MSTSDRKSHVSDHTRRESDLSAPVSDYEYLQPGPTVARPPPTPQTPVVPPVYNVSQAPVSPPLESKLSQDGATLLFEANQRYLSDPEVVPEGIRRISKAPEYSMQPDNGEKEAYIAPTTYYNANQAQPNSTWQGDAREDPTPLSPEKGRRKYPFGLSKKRFVIVTAFLIAAIIAIAVGVGVGVGVGAGTPSVDDASSTSDQNPAYTIGGASNPAYFSTDGAFNGSGVALADVNFGLDNSLYIFYQRYTGEIEQLIYESDGSWNFVTQVASDAKNATPLSTVAYIVDNIATWHLFYISDANIVKQRIQTNASQFQTNIWEDGPLNELSLQTYDGDTVGMQACYWGNYYGSLGNYDESTFQSANSTPSTGINIWYADSATSFRQYDWTNGQDQWTYTRNWPNMNGHAGVGCQSWLSNTTSYVFMVDLSNTINIYWKDINMNISSTSTHPINTYVRLSDLTVPNVYPSTSLGYTDFMIYQTPDSTIHGVNVTWAAENTTISESKGTSMNAPESQSDDTGFDEWALQPQDAGLRGTRMAITGSQPASGGRQELLFYQRGGEGDGLRLGKRDAVGGDFSFVDVPLDMVRG